MKIKLYNGQQVSLTLRALAGGYDQDTQRVVVVVSGEDGQAGVLTVDPAEARQLGEMLATAPVPRTVVADAKVTIGPKEFRHSAAPEQP